MAGADHGASGSTTAPAFAPPTREVEYVQGDACALPFGDGAFDVVFSNAVVEHVGAADRQRAFVAEAAACRGACSSRRRTAGSRSRLHTRLPLVHWLPEPVAHRAYDLAREPWAKENHLLGPADLRALFPVPVRIVNLGMTLVAIA